MNSVFKNISTSLNLDFAPKKVSNVLDRAFSQKGIQFDFRKYEHHVTLGKGIISDLWKN